MSGNFQNRRRVGTARMWMLWGCLLGCAASLPSAALGAPDTNASTVLPTVSPRPLSVAVASKPRSPVIPGTASAASGPVVAPYLKDGYWVVGYDKLSSFRAGTVLEPQGPKLVGTIPDDIKALDDKQVAIRGFMMPVQANAVGVTECLLLKNQSMCCFGKQPLINEWMVVRMLPGAHLKRIMDIPVTIYGKLHVGEYRENGRLRAIYRLDGEKMEEPKGS